MKLEEINNNKELLDIAKHILQKKMSLIEGAQRIDSLINTEDEKNDFLLPIKGIISEAEDMVREQYKIKIANYVDLMEYKDFINDYFERNKQFIIHISYQIIEKYDKIIEEFNSAVKKIFTEIDPITIYAPELAKKYTYEVEIGEFMKSINKIKSSENASDVLRYLFDELYGESILKDKKTFDLMGKRIWEVIN